MNNNIKISLTIELEGSTLVRKSEPEKVFYKLTNKDLNPTKKFESKKEAFKIVKRGYYKNYPLEAKPAFQHINLTVEAYEYMISAECPSWAKPRAWDKMTKKERLEKHLSRTCEHFRGKSFTYKILDD